MAAHGLDQEDRRLALQLQIEDLESLKQNQKRKQKEGDFADDEAALDLYKQELEASMAFDQDRALCCSIAQAVRSDGDLVQSFVAEDNSARQGPLNRGSTTSVPSIDGADSLDAGLLRRLEALNFLPDQTADSAGESSAQGADGDSVPDKDVESRPCTVCEDYRAASDLASCPCSHEYCHGCLSRLFDLATVDESLFPPRCCQQPILVDDHLEVLGPALVGKFKAKALELSTPNRTYCHRPECSTFIPPQYIQDGVATCVRCSGETCISCKGARHARDCPQDKATQDVLRLAKENGWQSCYSCHRLVELGIGCNHMTCICRAEFCYKCGERWKHCACAVWDEQNLYGRAEAVADRNPNNRALQGHRRAEVIQRAVADLVQHHACVTHAWDFRRGQHRCEHCHDVLPVFIFECTRCHILACRRCRLNRL